MARIVIVTAEGGAAEVIRGAYPEGDVVVAATLDAAAEGSDACPVEYLFSDVESLRQFCDPLCGSAS